MGEVLSGTMEEIGMVTLAALLMIAWPVVGFTVAVGPALALAQFTDSAVVAGGLMAVNAVVAYAAFLKLDGF